ncbi:cytokinesis regulator [Cordyceps militaris CM01]|uniref:Cytokinesis regulator n=1 Tax=Cordyceps militaris (strain CM01) TaxID=983644 RepID=G3JFW0_CORMM|nr:cytokinesis regulator [Cordyceps militaris CM01]EGX93194.1 cytokinesis regulator [Cordyceps militaris CM01]
MATLKLKERPPAEDIESWDDDGDFLIDGDDLSRRTSTTFSNAPLRRRDSTSSHVSFRSELESMPGDEQQFHIPGDDESSTMDAIAAAQHVGVPLPQNVPTTALMGGTIKRLGGRKIQKIIQDDWENDLEIPEFPKGLVIKTKEAVDFPDTLRQVSAGSLMDSPTHLMKSPSTNMTTFAPIQPTSTSAAKSATSALTSAINLDKFKDSEDDDFFGPGPATVRVPSIPRGRVQANPVSFITPPTPQKKDNTKATEDGFEDDLELPSDGKLTLSTRRDIPTTPSQADDLDWGEGSLGTRWGGTRRDGRSARSSSASALSPSISSSVTAESEDETFDGLLLPTGPLNFRERLQRRKNSPSPSRLTVDTQIASAATTPNKPHVEAERQDPLDGLDIGDGDVFESAKLSLHRNIKIKESQPASPARPKTAISLTFSNKPITSTRLPRLSHERSRSTALEPVSESGGPIQQRSRRPQSRLGHSAQSSVVSVPTPTTLHAPPFPPSTPRRREVTAGSSFSTLRNDTASTTNSQLLRQKRSMPAVRQANSPMKPPTTRSDRPPSRDNNRPQSGLRPKTPVERIRQQESPTSHSKKAPSMPFIPAGSSQSTSHHVTSKGMRQFRRWDSENAIDTRSISRTFSRSAMRSPSPQRFKVAADTWERLSKPKNKRNFGDGHELDGFDDLPTSKEAETRFLRQPNSAGIKPALKNKTYLNLIPDRIGTPAPQSPAKPLSSTPRFARDTAASRIARETSLANRIPANGPLATISAQRGTNLPPRGAATPQLPSQHIIRSKKPSKRVQQQKPHLIANLNSGKESRTINGMYYNADTFRWEGNENVLNAFDHTSTQSPAPSPAHLAREKDTTTPRPALITNISSTKGVQVVGGMVFDPQNMCWLKIGPQNNPASETSDTMDGFNALDDEEDVFKDIPDLDDHGTDDTRGQGRASDIKDEWLVGEEFDVGPEFIRRQREEEDRWRRKCEKWVGRGSRDRDIWRWTIRELVSQFDDLSV